MDKEQSKKFLHNYMINNYHIKGEYTYLGCGVNGHAYRLINDLVIKITTDIKEIEIALYLNDISLDFIIKYHTIEAIHNIGYIIMDYVKPLDIIIDRNIINKWVDIKDSLKIPMMENGLDIEELHWGNCGIDENGKLLFFDLK